MGTHDTSSIQRVGWRQHTTGQSLVLLALVLPLLFALVIGGLEVSGRLLTRMQVRDALVSATRAATQQFQYQAFAENDTQLNLTHPTWGVVPVAERLLTSNLQGIPALAQPIPTVVGQVQWTIVPAGGSCTLGDTTQRFASPALCATLETEALSLFGTTYPLRVLAATTLDQVPGGTP